LFKQNVDYLKKFLIPFILLFIIPVAGWISHIKFYYVAWDMKEGWLQEAVATYYYLSFYLSPIIVIIQMVFFIVLLIASIKEKQAGFIVLSIVLILVNCCLGFLSLGRILMAVSGV
jgi:hypothetical protein